MTLVNSKFKCVFLDVPNLIMFRSSSDIADSTERRDRRHFQVVCCLQEKGFFCWQSHFTTKATCKIINCCIACFDLLLPRTPMAVRAVALLFYFAFFIFRLKKKLLSCWIMQHSVIYQLPRQGFPCTSRWKQSSISYRILAWLTVQSKFCIDVSWRNVYCTYAAAAFFIVVMVASV